MEDNLSDYLPKSPAEDPSTSVLRCKDTYKKLQSFAFNAISLGQWETARASFQSLALSDDPAVRNTAKELLKILVLEAANYW